MILDAGYDGCCSGRDDNFSNSVIFFIGYIQIHSVAPDANRDRKCSGGDESRHHSRSQYHLSDRTVVRVRNVNVGAVAPDPLRIVESGCRSSAVGRAETSRASRNSGHDLSVQNHLADGVVSFVGDEQVSGNISCQSTWGIEPSAGSRRIGAAR